MKDKKIEQKFKCIEDDICTLYKVAGFQEEFMVALTKKTGDRYRELSKRVEKLEEQLSPELNRREEIIDKPKVPVLGKLAIFWNDKKAEAIIAEYRGEDISDERPYYSNERCCYVNAILFESIDQYTQFKKN